MSRIVRGSHLLDAGAKERMRVMLHRIAQFCGIEVITYAVMSNHFHVLIRVDPEQQVTDEEIIGRCKALYGSSDPRPEVWRQVLAGGGSQGDRLREQLRGRMGNASVFMQLFKQRYSIWFNRRRAGFGTLWAERFKAVLVQDSRDVLAMVAGYIDLNPLRARLCRDPKDYRWCGYAEAAAGHRGLRQGLGAVYGTANWNETSLRHRRRILGDGPPGQRGLTGGKAIKHRLRYLADGLVLGTQDFVEHYLQQQNRQEAGRKRPMRPRPLPDGPAVPPSLTMARALRREQRVRA